MSDKTTHSAEPENHAVDSARPQPELAMDAVTAGAEMIGAAQMVASSGDGLSALQRFPIRRQHQTVLALQRTRGNAVVQRLLVNDRPTTLQRHTSVALEEEENAIKRHLADEVREPDQAIQRHTSVALAEEENAIKRSSLQRASIQRDLASELSDAVDGWGTDEDAIFAALDAASADDKRAVLNNSPLIADLRGDLSGTDLGKTMVKLGQPLADQIDYCIAGAGTDDDALFYAIESAQTPDSQRTGGRRSRIDGPTP